MTAAADLPQGMVGGPAYAPGHTFDIPATPGTAECMNNPATERTMQADPVTATHQATGTGHADGGSTPMLPAGSIAVVSATKRRDWPVIEDWRMAQQAQGLSARTVTERCRVAQQLADAKGDPLTLTTRDIRAWIGGLTIGAATLATYDRYCRALFRFLLDDGLRADDPMAKARRVKDPRREARPITDPQLEALLATRMHRRTYVMVLLCAFQGLRVHEVAKVRGEDVDPVSGLLFVIGKGGVRASLPLHPLVAQAAQHMPRSGFWFPTHAYTGRGDTHIHGNSVSAMLSEAMERAGIPGGTAHRLRHWYGTSLVKGGTNLRAVQQLLRHASLATTERYVQVEQSAKDEGVARLGRGLTMPPPRKGAA